MPFASIRKKIASAVEHEARTGALARVLRQIAKKQGIKSPDRAATVAVRAVRVYVESVPAILEAMQKAARKAGIGPAIAPVVKFINDYFVNPADVIPDRLGLWGLLDDAYLARSIVSAASELVQAATGNPLIPVDLSDDNLIARKMLGPKTAAQIEVLIATGLASPVVTQLPPLLAQNMAGFGRFVNDPMWGSATVDEVVNARLGALGVV